MSLKVLKSGMIINMESISYVDKDDDGWIAVMQHVSGDKYQTPLSDEEYKDIKRLIK